MRTDFKKAPRCSYGSCGAIASCFCVHCHQLFCGPHDQTVHILRSRHERVQLAMQPHDWLEGDIHAAAVKLRSEWDEQITSSAANVAAADSEIEALRRHLADAQRELQTKQQQHQTQLARLTALRAQRKKMTAASDLEVIDLCAKAIAEGTLQLDTATWPSGVLRELTSKQREHFTRLLPDVKPVRQHNAARIAGTDCASFTDYSRCLLVWLCNLGPGKAASALLRQ